MKELLDKKHFLGIDISNDVLDLALMHEENYGDFEEKQINNTFTGFEQMLDWLNKKNVKLKNCLLCMEHTGTYGLLLFAWLSQMGIDYCVEPGLKIKRSLGITRGKNDKIDARRLADYAYTNKAKLEVFTLPSTLIIQIKQYLTYRGQIVKINTSLKNSLKSHNTYQKVSGVNYISEDITTQIEENENRIKQVEKKIIEIINSNPEVKKILNWQPQ